MRIQLRSVTALALIPFFTLVSLSVGCKSRNPANSPPSTNAASAPAATSSASAPAPNQPQLTVDDLVAPIALYPDQLLAQILTASTDPQQVLDGGNWLLQNQDLKGDALIKAANKAGFGPSMQYLMAFPQVVDNMCQEMDWTAQLGQAFSSDQKAVMDAIQRKRTQAQQMGNLNSSPQLKVEGKAAETGQRYIEIRPSDPKVVYVPQYNPVTIYNTPAPASTPPATTASASVSTEKSGVSSGTAVAIGLLSFGVGMAVGSTFNNNRYYPYPAWGYGGIYYAGRPYYPPAYHPPYPVHLPAYGYNPPPDYRWSRYNQNVNVNINNNYYAKFQTQNRPTQLPANTTGAAARPSTLPANDHAGNQQNWKGQNTYQGARPTTLKSQTPGASMANAIPSNMSGANRDRAQQTTTREGYPRDAGALAANRSENVGTSAAGRGSRSSPQPTTTRGANTGLGANRAGPSRGTGAGIAPAQPNLNRGVDRGYGTSPSQALSTGQLAQNRTGNSSAFAGVAGGASDRAASNRGRSSMGAGASAGRARNSGYRR